MKVRISLLKQAPLLRLQVAVLLRQRRRHLGVAVDPGYAGKAVALPLPRKFHPLAQDSRACADAMPGKIEEIDRLHVFLNIHAVEEK